MNLNDCFSKSLLIKVKPDVEKSKSSIKTAEHKLELSKTEFDAKIYEGAVISAYASMFHSARAILFKDGVKERSHYAVYVYLKEKYGNTIGKELLNSFSALRLQRHEVFYGFSEEMEAIDEEETKDIILTAKRFLSSVKRILS